MKKHTNTYNKKEPARFGFGKNWQQYSHHISEERIAEAERSLLEMLGCDSLQKKSFLDIGSGSGLFSLAAARLGAQVCSFDYDNNSVACTEALRQQYHPAGNNWAIQQGSILDADFIKKIGTFDIVYSWGVLHHTGSMWAALANACSAVKPNGQLFIALYNEQGIRSKIWKALKRLYCSSTVGRISVMLTCLPCLTTAAALFDIARGRNPFSRYRNYARKNRGMTVYYDWIDWLGGYPFEVATPEKIIAFCKNKGLLLQTLKTTNSWGNNEFVFILASGSPIK